MSPTSCCASLLGPRINVWHKTDAQDVSRVHGCQSFLTKPASGQFSSSNPKIVTETTDPFQALPKAAMFHMKSTGVINGQSTEDLGNNETT